MSLVYKGSQLYFGGHDVQALAKKFGTPIYVYDLDLIAQNIKQHVSAFNGNVDIHYAMKANSNADVLKLMKKQKIGIDAVSGGELSWSLKCGFKPQDIIYSGVGKSKEEIALALKKNIKMINVESLAELNRVVLVAKKLKKKAKIGFRYNPDVSVDTHPYITTGFRDNKFGMDSSFLSGLRDVLQKNKKHLVLHGISLHIGSQLKDFSPLSEAILKTKPIYKDFQQFGLKYFDVGGGAAIDYHDDTQAPQTLAEYGRLSQALLSDLDCRILCEPGRVLVGEAGVLIAEVEYIKSTPYKNFVIINTGMHHLIRPSLYEAYHRVLPAYRRGGETITYDIVGPICESSDFIAKNRPLWRLEAADIVAIGESGAYGFTMASFYNLHKLPKEVVLQKKKATLTKASIIKDLKLL